jgi:transglutaminase-like putative cysteine protease
MQTKALSFLVLFFILFLGFAYQVMAITFNVQIDRIYTLTDEGKFIIEETRIVKNDSENLLVSNNNKEVFQIPIIGNSQEYTQEIINSLKAKVDDKQVEYTVQEDAQSIRVEINYPKELRRNQQMKFTISYVNNSLVKKSGAIFDVYVPGFAKEISFQNGQTTTTYNTKLKVAKTYPEGGVVIPNPISEQQTDNYREFTFSQESLIGENVWLQLGDKQNFAFTITQKANPTEERKSGYSNEYRIILPRNILEEEVEQKVYFSSFSHEPKAIINDENNNIIAYFDIDSYDSTEIVISGFAQVSKFSSNINKENSGSIDDYSTDFVNKYTQKAEFWEVDSSEIQKIAQEIKGDKTNIYELIEATYQYVIDTIDYSEIKRFGINERQGALKTLQGGAAVCMEYSDLFLALLRAQGIPTRAVFGYGYDTKLNSAESEAHQWVQVYIPTFEKWMSVDVTWGESGESLIGGDLNHFYIHVASIHPNKPSMVERKSHGRDVPLNAPQIDVMIIENFDIDELMTDIDLQQKYGSEINTTAWENFRTQYIEVFRINMMNIFRENLGIIFIGIGTLLIFVSSYKFIKLLIVKH